MTKKRNEYINRIKNKYLEVHDTPNWFNKSDYQLAERLFEQGIRVEDVETAILLASARRFCRSTRLPKLNPIRSFYYFVPVIEEVVQESYPQEYLQYLQMKMSDFVKNKGRTNMKELNSPLQRDEEY